MSTGPPFYIAPGVAALRQGEILSDVLQAVPAPGTLSGSAAISIKKHPLCVVISQDCDLEQDYRARETQPTELQGKSDAPSDKLLPNVLLCEVHEAATVLARILGKDIKKRINQNKDERYQYLQQIGAAQDVLGSGIPALIIDFKRYFTVPTDDLYSQLRANSKRRTVLAPQYVEHLSSRFAYYLSRVALPRDHQY